MKALIITLITFSILFLSSCCRMPLVDCLTGIFPLRIEIIELSKEVRDELIPVNSAATRNYYGRIFKRDDFTLRLELNLVNDTSRISSNKN